MALVPDSTQFVGYSDSVNLDERKSQIVNADSVTMTTGSMLDGMNMNNWNPISITTDGSVLCDMYYEYYSYSDIQNSGLVSNVQLQNGVNNVSFISNSYFSIDGDADGAIEANEIYVNNIVTCSIAVYTNNLYSSSLRRMYFPDLVSAGIDSSISFESGSIEELYFPILENASLDIRCINLETLYLPLFNNGTLTLLYSGMSELNMPSLSSFQGGCFISECNNLISINESNLGFQYLEFIFGVEYCSSIQSISLNKYNYSFDQLEPLYIKASNCGELTSFSMSNIIEINSPNLNIDFGLCPLLTDINIGTVGVLKKLGSSALNIYVNLCPISEQSMENMLALLVSLDGTNGTTLRNSGNVYFGIDTPIPNAQSLEYISILTGRGWTITHN